MTDPRVASLVGVWRSEGETLVVRPSDSGGVVVTRESDGVEVPLGNLLVGRKIRSLDAAASSETAT